MNIVPTFATRKIARRIVLDARFDVPADAVMRHLPDLQPEQIPALLSLLAKAAVSGEPPVVTGRPREPLMLTPEQRRTAHCSYIQGNRDDETVFGEREYQRAHKRRKRGAA